MHVYLFVFSWYAIVLRSGGSVVWSNRCLLGNVCSFLLRYSSDFSLRLGHSNRRCEMCLRLVILNFLKCAVGYKKSSLQFLGQCSVTEFLHSQTSLYSHLYLADMYYTLVSVHLPFLFDMAVQSSHLYVRTMLYNSVEELLKTCYKYVHHRSGYFMIFHLIYSLCLL